MSAFMTKFASGVLTGVRNYGRDYVKRQRSIGHKVNKVIGAGIVGTTGAAIGINALTQPNIERRLQATPTGGSE